MQNFPAAGLRWELPFRSGENRLKVVAHAAGGTQIVDEISFIYKEQPWGAPAAFAMEVIERSARKATVEARLHDQAGLLCLDARNVVRFTLAGTGSLIDNQGTSTGSRVVQLYNGRVQISVANWGATTVVGLHADGVPSASCPLGAPPALTPR